MVVTLIQFHFICVEDGTYFIFVNENLKTAIKAAYEFRM